jgi:hypothetical protein
MLRFSFSELPLLERKGHSDTQRLNWLLLYMALLLPPLIHIMQASSRYFSFARKLS